MGNSSTKDSSEELLRAIQRDDVPSVRKLLQRARSANENALNIDQEGGSLLHCVAANGAIKVLSLLMESIALDVNQQDNKGQTALHRASDKGVILIVQELIKFTPNVNTRDKKGATPLHLASYKGHVVVVQALLKAGAEVNMQLERGQTALQLAATKNYAEVARVLLDAKADVNLQEKNGLTALHAACDGGFIDVINDLLEHEADVNIQDKDGCSPLHLAAQSGRKPIVDLLLDKSPRVNIQKNNGWTALHIAAQEGHKEVVETLLEADADVNSTIQGGWTALHIASQNGKKDVVQVLLIKGAKIDFQSSLPDLDGWSALHMASYGGHKEVVEILLAAQANIVLKTKNGDTALSLATGQATSPEKNTEKENYELIADLLRKATTTKKFKAEQENPSSISQPSWVVDRSEIILTDKVLGIGGWGTVQVAKFRGLSVAAKCIHQNILSKYNIALFKREMNLAAITRHPNLLQFIGATIEGNPIILMELMQTSLRAVLENVKNGELLSRQQIVGIAKNVALGLNYLHNMKPDPIIHRDLSSANVLLECSGTDIWKAKISDFGAAIFLECMNTPTPGNVSYAAA
eukprot:Em0002g842a